MTDRLTATEQVARWMIANGYATGHGDDVDDLLRHLVQEVRDQALRAALAEPKAQGTHSADCYKFHHGCAKAEVERLRAALAERGHLRDATKMIGEPVARGIIASNTGRTCRVERDAEEIGEYKPEHVVPLYTAPPRRSWASLTDEERLDAFDDYLARTSDGRHLFRHSWSYAEEEREAFDAGVAVAEAALKEKNA